jgi:ATP-binding cassette subfamily F protein uup
LPPAFGQRAVPEAPRPARSAPPAAAPPRVAAAAALSFSERHRLEALPAQIDRLTAEIGKLSGLLAEADLFARDPLRFRKATAALVERQAALAAAEEEWLVLAEKAERAGD